MTTLPALTWAVTDAKGHPVTTLAALADVLGMEAKDAADELLGSPYADVAPPELTAEAQDALDSAGDPDGTGEPSDDDDGEGGDVDDSGDDAGDGGEAPDAPEGKAKGPMFKPKGDGPPPINHGTFVSWSGGRGRVDLIVTNGTVPGVDGDTEGTTGSPAARVVVYAQDGGTWKATGRKVAAKVATLKRIPPLTGARFGKKSVQDELEDLRAEADALADGRGLGLDVVPPPSTLLTVYERGVKAWPGSDVTDLTARDWAIRRARAFCTKALGEDVAGYIRDDDLLGDDPTGGADPDGGGDPGDPHEAPDDGGQEPPAEPPAESKVRVNPADVAAALQRLRG